MSRVGQACRHLVKPGPVGTYRRRPGQACRRDRARLVGAGPGLPLAGGGGGPGLARVGQAWRESDVAEVARATGIVGAVLKFLFLDLVFERLIEPRCSAQLSVVFSGVFCFWVYTAQPLVVEELDLPAEPQLCAPEHKSFPAVGRSVFESWSCSALCLGLGCSAPIRARLLRTSRRSTGAQPAVFVPPPAAACRCAAISGRCCRCRGLLRTRTSICSDVDSPAGAARMGVWA